MLKSINTLRPKRNKRSSDYSKKIRSARYKRLRALVLKHNPLCLAHNKEHLADSIDHIVPCARGGAFWDLRNWMPTCQAYNYSKKDNCNGATEMGEDGLIPADWRERKPLL